MSNSNNSNMPMTYWGAAAYSEVRINPPGAIIRKIILIVCPIDLHIAGIEFFDGQGTTILKCGV